MVASHLGHGYMGEYMAGAEQAVLLAEHGTQQHVRADEPFHQHIGLATSHGCHSLAGSRRLVIMVYHYGLGPSLLVGLGQGGL